MIDVCSVEGCDRKRLAKGLCSMHWQRNKRHGDPTISTRPGNGTLMKFIKHLVDNNPGDVCVLWPYWTDKKKYGMVDIDGKKRAAHRVALIQLTGIDPPGLNALHGPCNNPSCVNPHPEHGMRWGTISENMMDRVRDGTANRGERHGRSKLTADDVIAIRDDPRKGADIAADYPVSAKQIHGIKRRESWGWL